MLKKFIALVVGLKSSFVPSSVSVAPAQAIQSRMRHLEIYNPPNDFTRHIEWNLDNVDSVKAAQALMRELRSKDKRRNYFVDKGNSSIGKMLVRGPDIEENMISMPGIYEG